MYVRVGSSFFGRGGRDRKQGNKGVKEMGREGGGYRGWWAEGKEERLAHIQVLKLSGFLKESVKFLLHHHCPKPAKPITFKS